MPRLAANETGSLSVRSIVLVTLAASVVVLGSVAYATADRHSDGEESDAPVVTVDSSVEEQIDGMAFALADLESRLPSLDTAEDVYAMETRIGLVQDRIATLCLQAEGADSIPACVTSESGGA